MQDVLVFSQSVLHITYFLSFSWSFLHSKFYAEYSAGCDINQFAGERYAMWGISQKGQIGIYVSAYHFLVFEEQCEIAEIIRFLRN